MSRTTQIPADLHKDIRGVISDLPRLGFTFESSDHGPKLYGPDGSFVVILPSKRSRDFRAIRNAHAALRRVGIIERRKGGDVPTAPKTPEHQQRVRALQARMPKAVERVKDRKELIELTLDEGQRLGLRLPQPKKGAYTPEKAYQSMYMSMYNVLKKKGGQSEWMLDLWEAGLAALDQRTGQQPPEVETPEPETPLVVTPPEQQQRTDRAQMAIEGAITNMVRDGKLPGLVSSEELETWASEIATELQQVKAAAQESSSETIRAIADRVEHLAQHLARFDQELADVKNGAVTISGSVDSGRDRYRDLLFDLAAKEPSADLLDRLERVVLDVRADPNQ